MHRFALVCDPKYCDQILGEGIDAAEEPALPSICVNEPKEILTGPHWTYDLGWAINADELPSGDVTFTIGGSFIERLAAGTPDITGTYAVASKLDFTLSCFKVHENSPVRDPLDKKWHLALRTDPSSGYLIVQDIRQLPFWCSCCKEEIRGMARVCKDCKEYSVCRVCFMRHRHRAGHVIESVDVDV